MSENVESVVELPVAGAPPPEWPTVAVKDFGPIAEGEVELRPLTVFAGPSNTGKSWLATLIYVMARHVNACRDIRPSFKQRSGSDVDPGGWENFPENPEAWLSSLQEEGVLPLTPGDKNMLESFLALPNAELKKDLLRCFGGAKARDLVRAGSTGAASVTFNTAAAADTFATRQRLTIGEKGKFSLRVDVTRDRCRPASIENCEYLLDRLIDLAYDEKPGETKSLGTRVNVLHSILASPRYSSAHYLPAGRGSLMQSHPAIVDSSIKKASRGGRARGSSPALPGVLGDFLEQLIAVSNYRPEGRRSRPPAVAAAKNLEREILGGTIEVKKPSAGQPRFTYRPDGWDRNLSFKNASFMVSELAPVALYLRYYVGRHEFLILEHPEAHLHPDTQVRLVREIAGWVRKGIRVLITTHSEWILEEIANLIAAGEGKKEEGLPRRSVGVWLFEHPDDRASGSRIQESDWSVDEGGFASGFDDVAMALHNRWAKLLEGVE